MGAWCPGQEMLFSFVFFFVNDMVGTSGILYIYIYVDICIHMYAELCT